MQAHGQDAGNVLLHEKVNRGTNRKEVKKMSDKRRIEVFTAGCPLCRETLELVQKSVSACGCEVIERRCPTDECCAEAKQYAVRTMPTVVVDGQIVFEGRITAAQAALLSR